MQGFCLSNSKPSAHQFHTAYLSKFSYYQLNYTPNSYHKSLASCLSIVIKKNYDIFSSIYLSRRFVEQNELYFKELPYATVTV